MKSILCTTILCGALFIGPAQHITALSTASAAKATYQTTAKVNVRAGAGTNYKVLGTLKKNQTVTVKKKTGNWYQISFNGKKAYISTSYVKATKQVKAPSHITTANVTVRTGPGTKYKALGKLTKGQAIVVTKTIGSWYEISFNGKTGYISASSTKLITAKAETTFDGKYYATEDLNLRNGAGVGYRKIGQVPAGARVHITSKVGEWYKVTYEGLSGYVTSAYVKQQAFANEYTSNQLYEVGVTMPAGEYKLFSDENGYINVYKDTRNTLDFQQTITNFGYVTLQKGQFIYLQDAYAVPLAKAKPYNVDEHGGHYIDGMYKIGFDAPIGKYELQPFQTGTVAQYGGPNKMPLIDHSSLLEKATYTVIYGA